MVCYYQYNHSLLKGRMHNMNWSRMFFRRLGSYATYLQLPKTTVNHVHQRFVQWNKIGSRVLFGVWTRSSKGWRRVAWPSLGLVWAKCDGLVMEDLHEEDHHPIKQLEMNEAAALTHTSLLRQASGVMADSSIQLLHRTLRAILDFSAEYRKQVNEVIDLLEYCTATLSDPSHHDHFWDLLVAARSEMDSLKQQLKDLSILMTYVYTCLESSAMAAFINGIECTASSAQQAIDSAKLELEKNDQENQSLEMSYNNAHAQYIAASQKVVEEMEAKQELEGEENDDSEQSTAMSNKNEEEEEKKEEEEEENKR